MHGKSAENRRGYVYHVINRSNGKARIFHNDVDHPAFEYLLMEWWMCRVIVRNEISIFEVLSPLTFTEKGGQDLVGRPQLSPWLITSRSGTRCLPAPASLRGQRIRGLMGQSRTLPQCRHLLLHTERLHLRERSSTASRFLLLRSACSA